MTKTNITERLENNEYDLSPDFQRHDNLWDEEKLNNAVDIKGRLYAKKNSNYYAFQ